ncbi:MAG TPA: sterol desaturase family protein [Nannocystaceae bacterium]|nr:sterol desaturase family protein [Nannocystaceae bacterium]
MPSTCLALLCASVLVAIEAAIGRRLYDLRDTAINAAMAIGGLATGAVALAVSFAISMALWHHRIFELEQSVGTWLVLLAAEDLCYYCFHRVSHRVPFFWAAHEAHHSSDRYNFSTALRLSWTTPWTGLPFWWPLPLLGFHPTWIVVVHAASLAYQFLLHTQLVGKLGPLEWVLNTPSHHRVHHGCDAEYLDKNLGGIFIVWDRLFGTFAEERRAPTYGLVGARRNGPLDVAFGKWRELYEAMRAPGTWLQRCRRLLVPHGRRARS